MDPYKSVYGINFDVATELLRLTDNIFSANVCSCLERKRANVNISQSVTPSEYR
jgi:hypothetical protein